MPPASETGTGQPVAHVVLMSGGMDSAVTLALARRAGPCAALHVDYGQRTRERERQSFTALCEHFTVTAQEVVTLDYLRRIGGSCLTDPTLAVPEGEDPDRAGVPISYVPFRNTHLLALGVSWAEVRGAERVWFGAVEEDSSGYPDCRETFVEQFNRLIAVGSRAGTIRVEAPLLHLRKAEIIRRGADLGVPFERTWSCYQGERTACGRCDSCRLRLRGFREAGLEDPLPYAAPPR